MIADNEGALFKTFIYKKPPELERIVIGVDPAVSTSGNETGIIVAGIGFMGEGYILEDASDTMPPHVWAQKVVRLYNHYKADRVVAEINQGGDMVQTLLKTFDSTLSYKAVRATRGKVIRAEPIAALYEQRRVFHAKYFEKLEEQMQNYGTSGFSGASPDRLDALVWALTELFLEQKGARILIV